MGALSASLFVLFSLLAPGLAPGAVLEPLRWEQVFSLSGAPALVHAEAHYTDAQGVRHALDLLREGDRRVARRTDGAVELFVERDAASDYAYSIVDRRKKRLVLVHRTNLYRIGTMSDFGELATLVARPSARHVLSASARPALTTPSGSCRWLHVQIASQPAREICWSDRWKLPLAVDVQSGAGWARALEVDRVSAQADARGLRVDPSGLTVIRADDDIDPSQDM